MIIERLFVILVLVWCSRTLTAALTTIQYQPLVFKLTFSEPVKRPRFQLLYNSIYDVPYFFLSQQSPSSSFLFQADPSQVKPNSSLQLYDLLFSSPKSLGDGSLQLGCYSVRASLIPVQIDFPTFLGGLILFCGYFFNYCTEIGKKLVQLIHVYIMFMFYSKLKTTIYRELYIGMLMVPPADILADETFNTSSFILACLCLPLVLLLLIAVAGCLVKRFAPKERTILGNIVYQQFVFDAFIKVLNVFEFNLLFNSVMFMVLKQQNSPLVSDIAGVGSVLVYFNLITLLSSTFLKFKVMNPRVGQTETTWSCYLKSDQFRSFRMLHSLMYIKPWFRRNFCLFYSIHNLLIVAVFFWTSMFHYLVLLIEFAHIFVLFTLRPFKQEFYQNVKVICRLLFLVFYAFITLGRLYYSMGEITFNYQSIASYIVARQSIFLILVGGMLVIISLEIYFKFSNLNYQIKFHKQENQFRLELIEKNNRIETESKSTSDKHRTRTHSQQPSKSSSHNHPAQPTDQLTHPTNQPPPHERSQLRQELLSDPHQQQRHSDRNAHTKVEIELVELQKKREWRRKGKGGSSESGHGKWRYHKESLLSGLVHKQQ